MQTENRRTLERLSMYCHLVGLFSVLLGMVVIAFDISIKDYRHIQVGIYVLITGYSFVKISSRISTVLLDENHPSHY